MKRALIILSILFACLVTVSQEHLRDYLGPNGQNTLRYEWVKPATVNGEPNAASEFFTERTVTNSGSNVWIKEVQTFESRITSESQISCVLTSDELRQTNIVTNDIMKGKSERAVEKILLKLPPAGQTSRWTFTDERDGTRFYYSVRRITYKEGNWELRREGLEMTEKADGIEGSIVRYYIVGIGLYKTIFLNDERETTLYISLLERQ